jgi:hypothetical protein
VASAAYLRANTIGPNQLAIRIKIIYYCLVGTGPLEAFGEERREKSSGLLCKSQL